MAAFPGTNGPIVFSSLRDGNRNIYVTTDSPGAPEIQLTNANADDQSPSVSADGAKVAFTSFRTASGPGGGPAQIWTMDIDGTSQLNRSNNTFNETEPTWSPDGTKIAFTSSRDGHAQIYVMNSNGTNQHRVLAVASNVADSQPAWSPDGTMIAFVSVQSFKPQVFVMDTDGANLTQISNGLWSDLKPNWSPDGTKLAFSTDQTGVSQIFTMPMATAAPRTQITMDGNSNVEPAYSPDGLKIVYVSHPSFTSVLTMEVPIGGGSPTQLTDLSSNDQPDWGPDFESVEVPRLSGPGSLATMAALIGFGVVALRRRSAPRRSVAA
jgi:TolB protein